MLTWLESWLHNIIAVILFAVIVELLLPNNKFLRYTRLVIGLILLLTILSPIMKIFEKDYLTQIDASYTLWEKQLNSAETQTLTLSDIQAKAKDIQEKRNSDTLKVTSQAIAKQMEQELQQAGLTIISGISVEMGLTTASSSEPYIKQVTVKVAKNSEADEKEIEQIEIKEIEPVTVQVSGISTSVNGQQEEQDEKQKLTEFMKADIDLIYSVLQRNWSIKKNQILVIAGK